MQRTRAANILYQRRLIDGRQALQPRAGDEDEIDKQEKTIRGDDQDGIEAPLDRHRRRQKSRDRHEQRYGYSVGAGQIVGRPERHHRAQRCNRQCPVHEGHINLSALEAGGVQHRRTWEEAELDCLLGQRERAGNDRLRRDDRRQGGEGDKAVVKPARSEPVKRVCQALVDRSAVMRLGRDS